MYNTQYTVERIKSRCKTKCIQVGKMLADCELSKNALSSMQSRGSWLQANNLAKIADYLNCSVDYLLGRTDNPEINKSNNIETYIPKTNEPTLPPRRIAALGADETKQITPPAPRRIT